MASTAADGDAGATGVLDHAGRVRDAPHVAVAEHGNAMHGIDHAADAVVIHAAGEALFASAAVNRDRGDADLLELAGELRSGQAIVVPTEPHLHRDRHRHRLHDLPHEIDRASGRVAHQGRAAAHLHDLADGAAHVDVHALGDAAFDEPLRGTGHLRGFRTEDLHGEGTLAGRG